MLPIDKLRLAIAALGKKPFTAKFIEETTGLKNVSESLSRLKRQGEIKYWGTEKVGKATRFIWVEIEVKLTSPEVKPETNDKGLRKVFPLLYMPAPKCKSVQYVRVEG